MKVPKRKGKFKQNDIERKQIKRKKIMKLDVFSDLAGEDKDKKF